MEGLQVYAFIVKQISILSKIHVAPKKYPDLHTHFLHFTFIEKKKHTKRHMLSTEAEMQEYF